MRFSGRDWWFILLLGTIYAFNFIDRMIIAVVGEPIRQEFGLSDFQLGIMGGAAFALFYGQLLLARMGVGIGEAGFTPPVVSMIADRFEPEKRATVFSMIAVGVSVGGAIGALGGGWIAQEHGWRMAFLVMGAPGLLLSLLLWLTIREPERRNAAGSAPPFGQVIRTVRRSRAFLSFTVGSGMVALVGFGLNIFLIPLLIRRFDFAVGEAALTFALAFSLATASGGVVGGILADRFASNNHRRYGILPIISTSLALPLYLAAIYQDDWRLLAGLIFAATFCLYAFLPTIMTVTQRLVEPRMRATAAAIHAFGQTCFGLGIGSAFLGFMSDWLAKVNYGAAYAGDCLIARKGAASAMCSAAAGTGLQQALLLLGLFLLLAIYCYWLAARSIAGEIAALEETSE